MVIRAAAHSAYWALEFDPEPDSRESDLLRRVISFVDMPNWKSTSLHDAARQGHGMAKALREEPWAVDELDHTGRAPIHHACALGDVEAVKELIRARADVNKPDSDLKTPLFIAAHNSEVECMRLLLQARSNVDQQDKFGNCAMHAAAGDCHPDAVALLLAAGASASARDWLGRTPLHYLAECPAGTNPEAIKKTLDLLLLARDVHLKARDEDSHTAAMYALFRNNVPVLRLFVEAGASLCSIDKYSWNLLHQAAVYANIDVLQYLLSCDPKRFLGISTSHLDADGITPWAVFVHLRELPDLNLGGARRPSRAKQDAFAKLYQVVRDANLRSDTSLMNDAIELLHQRRGQDARAKLATIISKQKEWKRDDLAAFYRGIDQRIQAGELESAIRALDEDIAEYEDQIGRPPWVVEDLLDSDYDGDSVLSSLGGEDGHEYEDGWETCSSEDEDEIGLSDETVQPGI